MTNKDSIEYVTLKQAFNQFTWEQLKRLRHEWHTRPMLILFDGEMCDRRGPHGKLRVDPMIATLPLDDFCAVKKFFGRQRKDSSSETEKEFKRIYKEKHGLDIDTNPYVSNGSDSMSYFMALRNKGKTLLKDIVNELMEEKKS